VGDQALTFAVFDLALGADADLAFEEALAAAVFLGTFVEEVFFTTVVDFAEGFVDLMAFVGLTAAGLLDLGAGMVFSLDRAALPAADSLTRPLGPFGSKKIPFSAPCAIA